MIRLDDLEKKAQAATQGVWFSAEHGQYVSAVCGDESTHNDSDNISFYNGHLVAESFRPKNAEYVASANPETILALIKAVRAAQNAVNQGCLMHAAKGSIELIEALKEIEP
jgi:predicted phosphoadenosine phosphosulfate sulfurtransferase